MEGKIGAPGFPSLMDDWARALTEGLSDVFGGMYSAQWYVGADLSSDGLLLRNIAFPRDPDTTSPYLGKDHWADRDTEGGHAYPRGLILGHCAYLMAQGGVHQRLGRTPELVPVHPLANEASGGLEVSEAARVWYRLMATRFAAVTPYDNETAFEKIRTECEAAAIDLYGEGSPAHRGVVQAFYAVGLHPAGETYGADVTALRWGHSWRFSRPYLGIPSPDWASPDLFINNGDGSEWNAVINPDFGDVHFENAVYCRVRNNRLLDFYGDDADRPAIQPRQSDRPSVASALDPDHHPARRLARTRPRGSRGTDAAPNRTHGPSRGRATGWHLAR